MLSNQRKLFKIQRDIHYLNGAYMSPQLLSVQAAGLKGLSKKLQPWTIQGTDFFEGRIKVKKSFAKLIECTDYRQTALIPSVSYGLANVAKNIPLSKKDQILLVGEQFPSNVYTWQEAALENGAIVKLVKRPNAKQNIGRKWNQAILESINKKTKVLAMAHVHWADGTLFDLSSIQSRCKDVGAKLIIDGTQSVGALPFSLKEIKADALIVGGYKWLMGPYSSGLAYYSPEFNEGQPIEHNWFNRLNSENFTLLTQYQSQFQVGAERYSVGESSNFIAIPMLRKAIKQIIKWDPAEIQKYCKKISKKAIGSLREKGCYIEDADYRGHHLFGIYLPKHMDIGKIKKRLIKANVIVSYRGKAIRVSPHVYNSKSNMKKLESLIY